MRLQKIFRSGLCQVFHVNGQSFWAVVVYREGKP